MTSWRLASLCLPLFLPACAMESDVGTSEKRATRAADIPIVAREGLRREMFRQADIQNLEIEGGSATGIPDEELDMLCGDWFLLWEEDENGDPVLGTFILNCSGEDITFS